MKQDKNTLKRILQLLKDIDQNVYNGIGKSERLFNVIPIEINKSGNILEIESQCAIINEIIEVKTGVYLHKT